LHLIRTVLKNVGPHAHTVVDWKRGLVGVYGRNGSGKSTLLDATFACLTNDWSRFDGVRLDSIYSLAGEDEESYVEVEAEHDGVPFKVVRGLRPVRHELHVPDRKKPYTSAGDISKQLGERLGIDPKLIGTYVFVPQRGMYAFLDQTPSVRAAAFQHLCRTTAAADACEAINNKLKELEKVVVTSDSSDELVATIARSRGQRDELRVEYDELLPLVLTDEELAEGQGILTKAERFKLVESQLAPALERLELAEAELVRAQALARERLETATSTASLVELKGKVVTSYQAALSALVSREKVEARVEVRRQALALVETDVREKPAEPAMRVDLDTARDELARLRQQLADARKTVKLFETDGVIECPTCGTPVTSLQEHITLARGVILSTGGEIPKLESSIIAEEDYLSQSRAYHTWASRHHVKLDAARRELTLALGDLDALGPRVTVPDDAVGLAAEYEVLLLRQESETKLAHKADRLAAAAESTLSAARQEVDRLSASLEENRVSPKRAERARQVLADHERAWTRAAVIDSRLTTLAHSIRRDEEALERQRTVAARDKKRKKAIATLSRLRDEVMHHTRLPQVVASANLAAMVDDINEALAQFSSPFWVEADEGLGFLVHFPGEPPRRAERLSPGLKGVFALAFRRAVASLFGADVGMMALDEPTDGLDAENLGHMRDALKTMADEVRGRRQIIVVTHAETLLPSFDQVVRVETAR
jgi:DNA repair exonuclease SbcCD ATPase subunit